jgi:predicted GNAT family acetyltransferase
MKREVVYPSLAEIEETNKIAARLFGTDLDETQAQPTLENALALISLEKENFICLKEDNKIIGWSVVLPTSRAEMTRFLNRGINEKELFSIAVTQKSFEALYLMAVIVLPEFRGQGVAQSLMKSQITHFREKYSINDFYSLILTREGQKFIRALERNLNISIPSLTRA